MPSSKTVKNKKDSSKTVHEKENDLNMMGRMEGKGSGPRSVVWCFMKEIDTQTNRWTLPPLAAKVVEERMVVSNCFLSCDEDEGQNTKQIYQNMEEAEVKTTMEQALSVFERLSLKAGDTEDGENNRISRKPPKIIYFCLRTQQPSTASDYTARLSKDRSRHRHKPYVLPLINTKVDTLKRNSGLEKLRGIKLEGDVDELRLTLSEQPSIMERSKSSSCAVEASRYSPWDLADEGVDGEVAELAEYFNQFVNICLKMSAQAESMYA